MGTITSEASAGTAQIVGQNLNSALGELIHKTLSGLNSATNFLQAQIPDVIHQMILFNIWNNILYISLYSLYYIIFISSIIWFVKKDYGDDVCEIFGMFAFIGAIIGFGMMFFLVSDIRELIQLYVAPKYWLVEHAVQMIQQVTQH